MHQDECRDVLMLLALNFLAQISASVESPTAIFARVIRAVSRLGVDEIWRVRTI